MANKADETYFVPAAGADVPDDGVSDLFPLIAEEDLA
ncbi:hypothetical protein SEA_CREWMATE_10 [Arthrobacter phage Crewmate]|uniref:Uncharacterized protein n=1 Tax=Arthrobacter phage Crewmate TaxID=2832317 RepID=A0AA49B4G1_9CAUD|nr:hypothetical protein PQE17_gp10 [Arthrobacter phage Crewmate]UIW13262.1 hypothetical protein SEA_CREWMATE_10 [Arthrobacter phage Crewmate]